MRKKYFNESSEKSAKTNYSFTKMFPSILLIIGILSILLSATISFQYLTFVGLLTVCGSASLVCGALLGFLFGIPKLNKNFNSTENTISKRKYEPNTNLEDISDWLTKIIVGVSLTRLTKIPIVITNIANYILGQNDCAYKCDFSKAIVISILIYFFIAGFIIGYFYTRLKLPGLLYLSEELIALAEKDKTWKQGYLKATNQNIITDNETQNNSFKLNSLTEKEIEIIKKVINSNNRYVIEQLVTFEEFTAISILIEKNIISISQGETIRIGATLIVIDNDIIQKFEK